ncbi:hypothetical protein NQZ79_g7498 [Umbelopsis isabellina]|nr:hypothetical protein NQZ79_g7498 [Umbelopsis isabellina]
MPLPTQAPHISNLINNSYNQPGINQQRPSPQVNYNQSAFEQPSRQPNVLPYQQVMPTAATAGAAEDSRSSKRVRVSRACDTCRRKKIRCDFDNMQGGQSCSTCMNSGWECTFNEVAKKRGPPKGYIDSLEDRLKKMERLLENIAQSGNASATAALKEGFGRSDSETSDAFHNDNDSQPSPVQNEQPPIQNIKAAEPPQKQSPPKRKLSDTERFVCGAPVRSNPEDATLSPASMIGTALENNKVCKYIGSSAGIHMLHPDGADKQEISFGTKKMFFQVDDKERNGHLSDRGAFVVRDQYDFEHARDLEAAQMEMQGALPPKDLIDVLVKTFFDHAMVNYPVISKKEFMDAFEGKTKPAPSRMLMNAMFCVACRHLKADHPVLKRHNLDPKRLFKLFTDRAAMAFTQQYFNPNVSTIQALLLVTTNPNYTPHGNPNWIWCGMAVRMAQDIGFHRCNGAFAVTPAQEDFAKRLWWTIYCNDRWTCAMWGRPLGISDADGDTEKPEVKTQEDETFIEYIKLSEIVGEVLRRLYSAKARSMAHGTKEVESVIEFLRGMLNEWRKNLPPRLNITDEELASMRDRIDDAVTPDKAYAEKVVILLNRPCINNGKHENEDESAQRCTEAAKGIIDVARFVRNDDIMHFGHTAALTVMQASFIHLYNAAKTTEEISAAALKYITTAMKRFESIWERWPGAPPVISLVRKLQSSINKTTKKDTPSPPKNESKPVAPSTENPEDVPPSNATADSSEPGMTPDQSNETPDENMFANWPIEQFVASLSDPSMGMVANPDTKQNANIPFWGAPSGYDWQEWGNFLVESGANNASTETIM